ncbi:protein of unknown function [Taphrina deformans PYCC 5710]|uniref:Uncharacterized protein n=1 Tax=Taphrina deformans (strain PYCC 5710 / ATCC 11124 / CBS 356.35 / IMI 108563 / JCM 9778 / NBRC 8474) TaxID=1097556 RepID=R5A834_TAPDE|nr:protein of unknown function [Taphrina deformans PYCC 5710]|eukprot:CCX35444.1 protein of unknown function [Taphrina deformans PYCC 5710]
MSTNHHASPLADENVENDVAERVELEVKKQMLGVEDRLKSHLEGTVLSSLTARLDKLEHRVERLDRHDTESGHERPSRKRKLGMNGPEVESQIKAMRDFAQSMVSKVGEVDGRLDILELRTTSIEETHTAVLKLADRFTYNDRIVVKHQAAMLQMRDYLTQHQDFIDGLCKTLGITANCGEEADDELKDFPIRVIDGLRTQMEKSEPKLEKAEEALGKIYQELAEMKVYLRRASEQATDWSLCRPGLMHLVQRMDPTLANRIKDMLPLYQADHSPAPAATETSQSTAAQ